MMDRKFDTTLNVFTGEEKPPKCFKGEIPQETMDMGINFLFPDLPEKFDRTPLYNYIQSSYKKLFCVALFATETNRRAESPFWRLCEDLGIDPGRREIVITTGGTLCCSKDYSIKPHHL